jgi:hypothetical protein
VEKIVIATKGTANDPGLIELLNMLFPECEICTVYTHRESPEPCPNHSLSEFVMTDGRRGSHRKQFDR